MPRRATNAGSGTKGMSMRRQPRWVPESAVLSRRGRRGRPGRPGRRHRAAVAALAGPVVATLATAAPAAALAAPPAAQAQRPVPVYAVHGKAAKVPVMTSWKRPETSWPAAGSATVSLPAVPAPAASAARAAGPGPGAVRAGNLPVWAGAASGAVAPSRVRVTVAPHSAASAAGIPGVILTVGRVDELGAAARLHVSVNYSSFAYAYGGNYASRLHLVELPACALTTPRVASCRTQTPLASADDVKAASVGADVSLPAAQAASAAGTGAGRARPARDRWCSRPHPHRRAAGATLRRRRCQRPGRGRRAASPARSITPIPSPCLRCQEAWSRT